MADVVDIGVDDLLALASNVLVAVDLAKDDAHTVADSLVQADLRGVHSHGVMRLPGYVVALKSGKIHARPNIRVVQESGSQAVMDGDGGMGQVAASSANRLAMDLCKDHGIGTVALRNSNHCGAMAYYAIQGTARHMLGIATTNAGINMPPTGGRVKLVGNNPVAIAVPTRREWPMVLDMATSVAAGGKLDVMAAKGEPIPLGWALDSEGRPTTDPVAGRLGALLPVGGPKGYGLAIMLDVLSGVLSGGRFGAGLGGPGSSQFFLMLDVTRFQTFELFLDSMDALIDQLLACPPAVDGERVYVPGEIEHSLQTRRLRDGIPLDASVVSGLQRLATDYGVAPLPI